MIALSDLIGQDAVVLRTAEKTGTVTGIGVDGDRVVSVGLSGTTIPAAAVRNFEGDVLTYDDALADDTLADDAGAAGSAPVRPASDPRGSKVLDLHGDAIGVIDDLEITADGVVATILLAGGATLPGSRLRAIGSYAAIVTAELPPPTGRARG